MASTAPTATMDPPDSPVSQATIHQSRCPPMAVADGAHPAHPVPQARPAPLDLLDPKVAPEAPVVLETMAALDPPDPLVVLAKKVVTDIPDRLATKVLMRPRAAKVTPVDPVRLEDLVQLALLAIAALLVTPDLLAPPAHKEHPAVPAPMATREHLAPLVAPVAQEPTPSTAHAHIVPRKLKQPTTSTTNSNCRRSCFVLDK